MNARIETSTLHRRLMQYDQTFGYRFAPGLKVRIPHEGGGYLVKTNRDGFRCEHEVVPTKACAHRVLVFGDSYTAGDGVSNGKRYSDVLEQSLRDVEVLNFGLSGSGTDQQYLVFHEYSERLEYDAVVIGVLVENITRNASRDREWSGRTGDSICVPKPWFEFSPGGELVLKGVPVPPPYKKDETRSPRLRRPDPKSIARRLVNKLGPEFKDWCQRVTRFQPLPEYDSPDDENWKLMKAILIKWISELRVPALIAVIPVYQYVEETASYKHVRQRFDELAHDTGARVYHVVDDLVPYAADIRRSFRFRGDCHMTPLAHKIVGEAMAKVLAPLLSCETLLAADARPAMAIRAQSRDGLDGCGSANETPDPAAGVGAS